MLSKLSVAANVLPFYCLPWRWPGLLSLLSKKTKQMYESNAGGWKNFIKDVTYDYVISLAKIYKFELRAKFPQYATLDFMDLALTKFVKRLQYLTFPDIEHLKVVVDYSNLEECWCLADRFLRNNLPATVDKLWFELFPTKFPNHDALHSHLQIALPRVQSYLTVSIRCFGVNILGSVFKLARHVKTLVIHLFFLKDLAPEFAVEGDTDFKIQELYLLGSERNSFHRCPKYCRGFLQILGKTALKKSLKKFGSSYASQEELQSMMSECGFGGCEAYQCTPYFGSIVSQQPV